MQRTSVTRVLPAICLLWAVGVSPLRAEPIVITSGLLMFPGDMTLQGAGFSFDGRVSSQANIAARAACFFGCEPGTTISLTVVASGGDVGGDVTYLDESFRVSSALDPRLSDPGRGVHRRSCGSAA